MNFTRSKFTEVCRPDCGAAAFFRSIFAWGVGMGCFQASFNNFLVDFYDVNGTQRGVLEFLRETPGVFLVLIFALLGRRSDWWVLKLGTAVALLAALLLLVPVDFHWVCLIITLWALGEHLVMPVRQSLALSLAREGRSGESLGILTSATNFGSVAGSLLVAAIFYLGLKAAGPEHQRLLYDVVWLLVALLMASSILLARDVREPGTRGRPRPALYFRRKFWRFYALELFYGARKQVFITFAPLVLIRLYGMETRHIALLFGISALCTAFWGGRLIGRLTDRWGYRNVMIWDTVVLFFVCLLYGFARDIFPYRVAVGVVCVNYILDTIISNASIATNLYARTLSKDQAELTATLSSGISVNHLITVFYALLGGLIFDRYGAGALFALAAVMALLNSAFALTIPKSGR